MKVLIIGAGPTGLTAGLEFARNGIIPEIVDAKEEPSKLSRAVGVLPRSIEILDRSGVGQAIFNEGVKADSIRIMRGGKDLIAIDFSSMFGETERLIGLPQDRTESIMSAKLAEMGVNVSYGTPVAKVENVDAGVNVTFENRDVKTYDWVIGADGINSTVRQSLGIPFEGYELAEEWSIADVEVHSEYNQTEFRAWLFEGDRTERDALVMVPIAPGRVRLVSSTPDSVKALPIPLEVKEIRRSGTFTISVRQAKRYVDGRVVLAGDAAHVHSPVGGRGMNLGIEDAAMVVEAILGDTLRAYEKNRKIKSLAVITWTERARKALVSKNQLVGILIVVAGWCVRTIPFLRRAFVRRVMTL